MNRVAYSLALALILVVTLGLAGCDEEPAAEQPAAEQPAVGQPTEPGTAPEPSGLDAIPADGPGESAALAGLPAAESEARTMMEGGGLVWPDIAGLEPVLTAYLLRAELAGQVTLFEVRADGVAHSIYAYQKAFDAGSLIWSPAEHSTSPVVAPRSEGETAAVAVVTAAMADAFPDSAIPVGVHGYRFSYVREGMQVLAIEVATDGSVISAGD